MQIGKPNEPEDCAEREVGEEAPVNQGEKPVAVHGRVRIVAAGGLRQEPDPRSDADCRRQNSTIYRGVCSIEQRHLEPNSKVVVRLEIPQSRAHAEAPLDLLPLMRARSGDEQNR